MRRRVLIIDDDREMRALLAAILETIGFDADLLSDGIAALELKQEYDAIIVDLNMPVFDGEQLLEYWSITQRDLLDRVIVLTGYSSYTRGRKLPRIFATLSKPFDYQKLMELVEQCSTRHLQLTTSCT